LYTATVQSFISISSSVGEELCLQEIWTDGRPDKQTDKQTDRFIYTHPKTNDDVIANVILH